MQLGALKMIKILFKLFVLYIAYLFFKQGYLIYIGEAKCFIGQISTHCSLFQRIVSATIRFIIGLFIFFLLAKSIYINMINKPPKLSKRGKYCWSEENKGSPYCCKCYLEKGKLSKLISIGGKYYCPKCDYTTIYFLSKGVNNKSIDSFIKTNQKKSESENILESKKLID